MSSPSLSTRQEQMRQRYMPAVERGERRRGRPRKETTGQLLMPPPKRKHIGEQCRIGYHYLDCGDLRCDCSCHVADGEYKGEPAQ